MDMVSPETLCVWIIIRDCMDMVSPETLCVWIIIRDCMDMVSPETLCVWIIIRDCMDMVSPETLCVCVRMQVCAFMCVCMHVCMVCVLITRVCAPAVSYQGLCLLDEDGTVKGSVHLSHVQMVHINPTGWHAHRGMNFRCISIQLCGLKQTSVTHRCDFK